MHLSHPGHYLTDVSGTAVDHLFENNPDRTRLSDGRLIAMQYPAIHESNQRPSHFMQAYCDFLSEELGVDVPLLVNRPVLILSDEEKAWTPQVTGKYWLICSGGKSDYITKLWGRDNYQRVVDAIRDKIQVVQVGESGHNHPPLDGVTNLVGETDTRQLIRLAWNSQGGIGGVSFMHHIYAALAKPFVCVASGMEAASWEKYNSEVYLTRQGQLPCCSHGGCWRSKLEGVDGCVSVVGGLPKCLAMINPQEVVQAILGYYDGGMLQL